MPNDIAREVEKIAEDLGIDRKRSIGEVAKELKVKTHVIRFWEENFPQIKPNIGAGGRRYYYNKQLKILRRIKKFLHEDGYTIAGLQKLLNRKKRDESKEEDLQIIIAENIEAPHQAQIEIDDFIDPQIKIIGAQQEETKKKIYSESRLLDFANLEIPAIDPKIKKEILKRVNSVMENLQKLKLLSEEF